MTDLNKLRSEFESVTEIYHCIYNADLDYYFSGSKFVSDKAEIEVNAGWKAWKKAKAQAVPEGYVLMPLEPTQEMLGAANLAPMPMVHIDSISGREKLRISTQYKAMVNVCKSGAEG
ncbi:hypothetical protein NYZ61_18780 [Acinetobacter baumannii]|nr:hypothetical protein [Acinetobacter baumannii]